jgi:3-dehydroquinate synthase
MSPPVFLVGFMAAGKTTVGRALAAAAGRRFVDLDDVIAAGLAGETGESVAQLVARDEAELRAREATALGDVIAASVDGPIVATGGGAAAHGDNLDRMRAAGLVVALGVEVADAIARAQGGPPRPLLARAAELAAKRAPAYRRAAAIVDTTGRGVDEVVASVRAVERTWATVPPAHHAATTILELGPRSYPIVVVDDPAAPFDGALIRAQLPNVARVAVITDHHVASHWLAPATAALVAAGFALGSIDAIEIAPGEASKSIGVYHDLCAQLIARGLDRSSAIIALGGGVVGDLAGFVAATLFRGIPVVQLPTTLVAMTDAAIGGKTAIDLPAGKNLVGAFHQPRLVACGLATLATLPVRERRAGFGELWKYALLDGASLWSAIDACAAWSANPAVGAAPPRELRDVIARAIAYKAAIVSRDEREQTGQRALLNLGHTVGHAIESAAAGALQHGEAVGLGLIAAARVSAALGLTRPTLATDITDALRRSGLPAELDPWLTADVMARLAVDKKRIGPTIKFIAVREVGTCEPVEIAVTDLVRILRPLSTP